jgi:hypothetical protein
MNIEDRDTYPSASSVARLIQCPASHRMELLAQEWGQLAEIDKVWALQGTGIHSALELQDPAGLETDEQRVIYSKLLRKLNDFLLYWHSNDNDQLITERRIWMHDGIVPIFSGQLDYARINNGRACLIDYKTGWSKAPEPKDNDQLKSLAVLLRLEHPKIETVTVQVLSPYYTHYPCVLSAQELSDYEGYLRDLLEKINHKQEPVPGEYCKHCAGLMICPAVRKLAGNFLMTKPNSIEEMPSVLPEGERAAKLLTEIALLEKWIEAARGYYKSLLVEKPDAVPGWSLYQNETRYFSDAAKAAPALIELIGETKFWEAVSISVTKIEKALPAGTEVLQDLTRKKAIAPTLGKSRKGK